MRHLINNNLNKSDDKEEYMTTDEICSWLKVKKATIYDYVDGKVDVLVASARARQRVYGTFSPEL